MDNPELIFYIITEALMVICIISHIFIATVWKRHKSVKVFFGIYSAITVCLCVVVALAFKGVYCAFYEPAVNMLTTIDGAPYLIAALAVAASCEFTGVLYLSKKNKRIKEENSVIFVGETTSYDLPDNTRIKNVRKHSEYKIVRENK